MPLLVAWKNCFNFIEMFSCSLALAVHKTFTLLDETKTESNTFVWTLSKTNFAVCNIFHVLLTLTLNLIFSFLTRVPTFVPSNDHGSAVERSPVRNIQVYNPTTNTLNVRWEAATGPVQQYRVVYAPLTGARPSESVSRENMSCSTYRYKENIS